MTTEDRVIRLALGFPLATAVFKNPFQDAYALRCPALRVMAPILLTRKISAIF